MIYENLILNQKIWNQLNTMIQNNTLPHALIFHGNEGTGKEAHAIEFAALLNSNGQENYKEKIKSFQHPNINLIIPLPREKTIKKTASALNAISEKSLDSLIDMKKNKIKNPYSTIQFSKASNILINSIRDIKKIRISDHNGYMVHIIFEAEKLCYPKTEPGNALLKILEEPPKRTIFILITSEKNKLLNTIQSRCCDFYFSKLHENEINKYLEIQNLNDNKYLDLIIKLSNNNMKNILRMIKLEDEINTLKDDAIQFIRNIINDQNWETSIKKIESLFKSKKEIFKIFIKLILFILNDLEKIKNKKNDCIVLTKFNKVKNLNYSKSIKIVEQYYLDLTKNLNPSIGLFSMAIEMKKSLYQHEII